MTVSTVVDLLAAGQRVRLRIDCGRGRIERPLVDRWSVQRFGCLQLTTLHEVGTPDHVGAFAGKPGTLVAVEQLEG